MAKRANPMAWGLAAILAAVVLGGAAGLLANSQSHLPEAERWVVLLPRTRWGFGRDEAPSILSWLYQQYKPGTGVRFPRRYKLGIITVRVQFSPHPLTRRR